MDAEGVRTVATRDLQIAYEERGPRDGAPVLLLHGFPDDVRTWRALADALAADGYRTIAPYVRGFGPTRFNDGIERTGEIAALASDAIALADALHVDTFHVVGHDWGGRVGYAAAVLAPDRLRSLCALAVVYGTNQPGQTMPVEQTRAYWYQWYFATPRGAADLTANRHGFCRALWAAWSPGWDFSAGEYDATAASFENPDFVTVVLSSYRQRWGFVPGSTAFAQERDRLASVPPIGVPTLVLMGRDDGATLPVSAAGSELHFTGPYRVDVVAESGHFLHRERPDVVAAHVREHLSEHGGP